MKILEKAVVLHEGWDMDNLIWISQDDDGNLKLLSTNHGRECESSVNCIDSSIERAQDSIDQLKKLKAVWKEKRGIACDYKRNK